MKTKILLTLTTVLSFAACTLPAHASDRGDKVAAAFGGFIGGVILGSHLDRDRGNDQVRDDHCAPVDRHHGGTTVIIDRGSHRAPSGYWKNVTERVWVPRQRIVSVDACGRRTVSFTRGGYEYRTTRVWVETGRGGRYAGGW